MCATSLNPGETPLGRTPGRCEKAALISPGNQRDQTDASFRSEGSSFRDVVASDPPHCARG